MAIDIENNTNEFFYKLKNKNKDFTLIARDCIGGIVYNQLGLRFLSPTINLFFIPEDFNDFCLHLKEYINGDLKEFKDENTNYPVGIIYPSKNASVNKPIRVDFMHYESFEKAKAKWDERKSRINWNNLFVVSSLCYPKEINSLSDKLITEWNQIKYKKVIFVDKPYGFDDEFVIAKPKKCDEYAWLLCSTNKKNPWKRVFNKFDFIKFLNNSKV